MEANNHNPIITENITAVPGDKPLLSKKKLLIIGAVGLVALGVGAFALLYQGPGQDVPDSQEPQLEFAAEGSKIAGIQVLVTNGGLSWAQYEKVYKVLNEQLPEMESAARFFVYVEDSLGSASRDGQSVYDNIEMNTAQGRADGIEAVEDATGTERVEMELVDTVVFTMRSESGAEYKVSVYTGGGTTKAEVTIEKQ